MTGVLAVVLAAALQAVGNGLMTNNLTASESFLLSLTAFGTLAAVFGAVQRLRSGKPVLDARQRRSMLWLNVCTAGAFLGLYWSYSLIPAPLASSIGIGIAPLAVAVANHVREAEGRRLPEYAVGFVSAGFIVALAVRTSVDGATEFDTRFAFGIAVATLVGAVFSLVPLISHDLARSGLDPVYITAHRFHLAYPAAFALLAFQPDAARTVADGARIVPLLATALVCVALPLFLLQIGMQRTPPLAMTLVYSVQPSLTYLAAVAVGGIEFDEVAFALINISLATAALGPTVIRRIHRRAARPHSTEREQMHTLKNVKSAAGPSRLHNRTS
ncbi:EamA family transporter [Salininema proteolyticum]|uniref:EamA family transporter n=1 Tax=Salininema proteolyticum TaxID=1607685 RepID=A0ABV8U2P1_9ACTN